MSEAESVQYHHIARVPFSSVQCWPVVHMLCFCLFFSIAGVMAAACVKSESEAPWPTFQTIEEQIISPC